MSSQVSTLLRVLHLPREQFFPLENLSPGFTQSFKTLLQKSGRQYQTEKIWKGLWWVTVTGYTPEYQHRLSLHWLLRAPVTLYFKHWATVQSVKIGCFWNGLGWNYYHPLSIHRFVYVLRNGFSYGQCIGPHLGNFHDFWAQIKENYSEGTLPGEDLPSEWLGPLYLQISTIL